MITLEEIVQIEVNQFERDNNDPQCVELKVRT